MINAYDPKCALVHMALLGMANCARIEQKREC